MKLGETFEIKTIEKQLEGAKDFLSINEAAKILNVSYFTVYRLVVVGEIDATKVRGIWRIPKVALSKYLQKRHPFNTEYF